MDVIDAWEDLPASRVTMQKSTALGIAAAVSLSVPLLRILGYRQALDNVIGAFVWVLFIGGGAYLGYWWIRMRIAHRKSK